MKKVCSLLILFTLVAGSALAAELLAPGDAIIAVDSDGLVSRSSYPGGEAPQYVLDSSTDSKYLNFGQNHGYNSGFIVTPAGGASVVQSFQLATGGDAPERDPAAYEIWGTNDPIASTDNSTGRAESWTLIASGTDAGLSTDPGRKQYGSVVTFANTDAFTSYRMTFPTVRSGTGLMQVSEVDLFSDTNADVLSVGDVIMAIQETPDSFYPGGENPGNLIDGDASTKYLNFGKDNTGFIVTPSGTDAVKGFQITTANDWWERDPASWVLYGTNDAITSADNSEGTGENWVEIDSGSLALPGDRLTESGIIAVDNDTAYASYKMMFPTLKDAPNCDSIQIAEVQFYNVPEPATMALLTLGGLLLGRRRK